MRCGFTQGDEQSESRASDWSWVPHVNGTSRQMVGDKEAKYADCMDAEAADGYGSMLRDCGDGGDGGPSRHDKCSLGVDTAFVGSSAESYLP